MPLILLEAPTTETITLQEAKDHCRVDSGDEDAAITRMIATAVRHLDGADGMLGRCLEPQSWKLTLDCFERDIALPLPPCISIDAIKYIDGSGVEQTVVSSIYQVIGLGGTSAVRIVPAYGQSWPTARRQAEAVSIEFTAGYARLSDGASPPTESTGVPGPLREALLEHVNTLYENRGSFILDAQAPKMMPQGYHDLTRNYREWKF